MVYLDQVMAMFTVMVMSQGSRRNGVGEQAKLEFA